MTPEPFHYRARKWLIQQITSRTKRPNQHQWLRDLDWDVVIVLDACRWKTIDDVCEWPFDKARSPGTTTRQWLKEARDSGIFEGAHIVSGQGQYETVDDLGASSIDLTPFHNEYDRRLQTVLPSVVLDRADDAQDQGKTPLVAHVLPPHAPYIAKVGDEWVLTEPTVDIWKRPSGSEGSVVSTDEKEFLSPQVAMATGYVDMDRARAGYRASVQSTWEVVSEYIGQWVGEGLTVVLTADHGETLGTLRDLGLHGHPSRCHIKPLTEVPFEVFRPGENPHEPRETTEEKLKALGYV